MKHPKVLARKQLPAKLPILNTLVFYLILDKFHAPQWLWGAVGLLMLLTWGVCIYVIATQQQIELEALK